MSEPSKPARSPAKSAAATVSPPVDVAARRLAVVLFFVVSLFLVGVGYWFYWSEAAKIRDEKYRNLVTFDALKVKEIERWEKSLLADVNRAAKDSNLNRAITNFLRAPEEPSLQAELKEELSAEIGEEDHSNVLIFSTNFNRLLATKDSRRFMAPAIKRNLQAALTNQTAVLSDFFPYSSNGVAQIDTAVAVRDGAGQPLAVLVVRDEVGEDLIPMVKTWPGASPSTEVVLVQREEKNVVLLNGLLHGTNAIMKQRFSLARTELPSVQAALGLQGRFEGVNFYGVKVLADLWPIPGKPWALFTKVNESEILDEAWQRTATVFLAIGAFIVLAGLGAVYFYRQRQAGILLRLYDAEHRKSEAQETYRATLYSIGDGVITTDSKGLVREMNAVAEKLSGWTEAEARGKPLEEIFNIINETTRAKVPNPVQTVLREKKIVGLANHTVLIARDGTERPIADSAAPIRAADGGISGVVLVFSDQSRRHAEQQTLQESEEKFRTLFENASDAIFLMRGDRFVDCNRRALEMFGCESRDQIVGHPPYEFSPPHQPNGRESLEFAIEKITAALTGRPQFFGWTHTKRDGTVFPAEVSLNKVELGGQLLVQAIVRDITERKQVEAELQKSEARFRHLFERASVGIALLSTEGKIVSANDAYARAIGYRPEEIQGRFQKDLDTPVSAELHQERFRRLLAGESLTFEAENYHKDGHIVPLDVTTSRISIGDKIYIQSFIRDITERKQAEKIRMLQTTALNAAANAIWITNRSGTIEWVNPAFTKLTGYSSEESIGNNLRDLACSGKQDAAFYKDLWDTITSGQVWRSTLINRRKDGSLYTEDETITPVLDAQGQITHFIAVKEDISQRLLMEEQFRQAQKMEAVGVLAGGVAHDFNNLLGIIIGNVSMAEMAGVSEKDRAHALKEISKASDRAANLTRQLLAFSRKSVMQLQTVNLNDVVSSMAKMLQRIIGEDITLQTQLLPGIPLVQADPSMLDQVLLNLAVNARDAMPHGGQIAIALQDVSIDEATATRHYQGRSGDFIRLSVEDTGTGIAPEILGRIFEPFFTTKDVGKGSGLGLATVRGILEQHHGWVDVESKIGKGTVFHVYLPRLKARPLPQTWEETASPPHGGSETILLVEDELSLRKILTAALKRQGYAVIEAHSGAAAVALWPQHRA